MNPTPASSIFVAHRKIDSSEPVFIIAEAGVNHNGDLSLARELVRVACEAGADAVKFQSFRTEELVTKEARMADYQVANTGKVESQFEMLKRLELSEAAHVELFELCKREGIIFLSTPFDYPSADLLERLGVPAFKVSSSDSDNIPFLLRLARTGKPVILSSGMSDLEELQNSVRQLLQVNKQLLVLQCTTEYPCPPEQVHLRAMATLREKLGTLVGLSDHTQGVTAAVLATVLGASVIEKHITLDNSLPGPDHVASSNPEDFAELVREVRRVSALPEQQKQAFLAETPLADVYLGDACKKISSAVLASGVSKVAKKSVVASQHIPQGTRISEEMLQVKRPGTGIRPGEFWNVLGKVARKDLKPDQVLHWEDLE